MLSTPSSSVRRHASRSSWIVHCCGWMITPTLNGLVSDTAVRLSKHNGGGADAGPDRRCEHRSSDLKSNLCASPCAAERIAPLRSGADRRRGGSPSEKTQSY